MLHFHLPAAMAVVVAVVELAMVAVQGNLDKRFCFLSVS